MIVLKVINPGTSGNNSETYSFLEYGIRKRAKFQLIRRRKRRERFCSLYYELGIKKKILVLHEKSSPWPSDFVFECSTTALIPRSRWWGRPCFNSIFDNSPALCKSASQLNWRLPNYCGLLPWQVSIGSWLIYKQRDPINRANGNILARYIKYNIDHNEEIIGEQFKLKLRKMCCFKIIIGKWFERIGWPPD